MRFESLASSSAGNAYIVSDEATRILVECGVPYRRLQKLTGFDTSSFAGCIRSHEHGDHAKCHAELIKNGVPVYATEGTAEKLDCDGICTFQRKDGDRYQSVVIGTLEVLPFRTWHDALEPVGFLIRSLADGERMLFATDTVALAYRVDNLDYIAIECNFEDEILSRATHIPDKVVKRIRNNHMEVMRLCEYLKTLDLRRCRQVYLLHLSDACSNESAMIGLVEYACPGIPVKACPKK